MGFFKNFFSLRKKRGKNPIKHDFEPRPYAPDVKLHPTKTEGDSEVAVSRLLRSSSAHFRVVAERDFRELPPLPHPIDTVSRSNTLHSTTAKNASVQTKNSYTVKVLQRELLSQTEFPNANPPLRDSLCTPRRRDSKSTPNLLEAIEPARSRQLSDPRKIPFTPRDVSRLNRLRQDPSVASLLNMYDDDGRLDENAFSNTPPPLPSALAKRGRRESTFKELLGSETEDKSEETGEGDLSWAERCIAESVGSTDSLSTISSPDSPPLETPTMPAFEDLARNFDCTYSSDSTSYPVFSSLEVELSIGSEDTAVFQDKANPDTTMGTIQRITRTPSQRASQVFNFLSEKRERRQSQCVEDMLAQAEKDPISSSLDRPVVSNFNIPQILINECSPAESPADPLSIEGLSALALPGPCSATDQATKPKARSTGAADILRSKRYKATDIDRRASRSSTGANILLYDERQCDYAGQDIRNIRQAARGPRPLPQAPADKGHKNGRRPVESRAAFGEITNASACSSVQDMYTKIPIRSKQQASSYSKKPGQFVSDEAGNPAISRPKQLRPAVSEGENEKENERSKKKGTTSSELISKLSLHESGKNMPAQIHMTPSRSRSFFEPASPVSSSELSPEAKQMMADARARKSKARQIQLVREKRSSKLAL